MNYEGPTTVNVGPTTLPVTWTLANTFTSAGIYNPSGAETCNVKGFGAKGNGSTDDTTAIQNAINFCFGSVSSPHGGGGGQYQNQELYFPNGHYIISGPTGLNIKYTQGIRLRGAGNTVSNIENSTNNGSVITTNGLSYSHIETLNFTCHGACVDFDLDWDGGGTSAGLQEDTFIDNLFQGDGYASGSIGVRIGHTGFMGSENTFLGNQFTGLGIGLTTQNANALQQTILGGNFQSNNIAIFIPGGSVPIVHGVGFQESVVEDIDLGTFTALDTMDVKGIRTESTNFILDEGSHSVNVTASSQTSLSNGFFFKSTTFGRYHITDCETALGQLSFAGGDIVVEGYRAGRFDWLASGIIPYSMDIMGIQYNTNVSTLFINNRQHIMVDGFSHLMTGYYSVAYVQNTQPFDNTNPMPVGTMWFDNTDTNNYNPKVYTTIGGTPTWATVGLSSNANTATSGYVLTANGPGTIPSFQTAGSTSTAPLILGSNLVEQRNGTNPQVFNVYGTYTNGSNYQRLSFQPNQGGGLALIDNQFVGTGTSSGFSFGINGTNVLGIDPTGIHVGSGGGGVRIFTNGNSSGWSNIQAQGFSSYTTGGTSLGPLVVMAGAGASPDYGLIQIARGNGGTPTGVIGNSSTDFNFDMRGGSDFNVTESGGSGTYLNIKHTTGYSTFYQKLFTTPTTTQAAFNINPATLPSVPIPGDLAFDSGAGNTLKWYNGSIWVTAAAVGGTGYDTIFSNGVAVTQRTNVNFKSGTNSTFSCVDNAISLATDCTVNSTGVGSGPTIQVNGTNTASQTTINFQNGSTPVNGVTYNFSNPSVGNIQVSPTGTLNNTGLTNPSNTFNGQTVALGATGNVNVGAAVHSVSLNQGNGSAITGATIGTAGRTLIDQGASADPSFQIVSGDCGLAATGAITCTKSGGTAFGTAAFVNTGTSGGTVGLLNGNLTFSGNLTLTGASNAFGTPISLTLTNATGLPLTGLASQVADTILLNATGKSAPPTAVGMPTGGTNGCAGANNSLIYNTTTHTLGCNITTGTAFQVNSTPLISTSTINFLNSAATTGLTLSFTNPSAGGVQLGLGGSLTIAGGGTKQLPKQGRLML